MSITSSNTCIKCGATTNNAKFCSRSCSNGYNNKLHPKRKRTPKVCVDCGCDITNGGCNTNYYRYRLCPRCKDARFFLKNATIAEVKQRVKFQYSAQIRNKARSLYKLSGKPKKCIKCGYDKHYEICHVKGINEFPTHTKVTTVNAIDNLIALCPNCHWEFDHKHIC